MRPDDRDLDDEIRGHLALSVKDRIERGEDPEAARLAALRELGYVPAIRDSIHRVWFSRWFDAAAALGQDMRIGLRSLLRAKGLAATVVVTLALGIGANAAIFSVVRGVLLRPLVNRDEDRLVYIRQSATGLGAPNTTFSVPEIDDFKASVTTISAFGDFSTIDFTLLGFGEPRVVQAGVVGGSYFDVMGLRPALGRLLNAADDGPDAAGVAVLTHRFWITALNGDPSVVGKTIRLGAAERDRGRRPRAVGAVSGRHRDHRQRRDQPASPRRDDGDRAHAPHDGALRPPGAGGHAGSSARRADRGARGHEVQTPRRVLAERGRPAERHASPRSARGTGPADAARAARRRRRRVRDCLLERRQPDPGALRAPRGRAGHTRRARRQPRRAPPDAAGRKPRALRRRRRAGRDPGPPARGRRLRLRRALFGARARGHRRRPACSGLAQPWRWSRPCCSRMSRACRRQGPPSPLRGYRGRPDWDWRAAACGSRRAQTAACARSR